MTRSCLRLRLENHALRSQLEKANRRIVVEYMDRCSAQVRCERAEADLATLLAAIDEASTP